MTGEDFDALARSLDAAMVVVTTAAGGERAGCLVGFHSQCSIHPRRYAVWLSKANHTYRLALFADHLAVHVLSRDDRDLAAVFGSQTGDDVDKFTDWPWEAGPGGVPLLARCPARMVLRRIATLDVGGDHSCVVGEPVLAQGVGGLDRLDLLRLVDVLDLTPGHEVDDRPTDPGQTGRAARTR